MFPSVHVPERARSQFSTVQILRTGVSNGRWETIQWMCSACSGVCSGILFWLPCIGLVPKEVELRQAFICGRRPATSERILQDFLSCRLRSLRRHRSNMQCQQKIVAGKKNSIEDLEKVKNQSSMSMAQCPSCHPQSFPVEVKKSPRPE